MLRGEGADHTCVLNAHFFAMWRMDLGSMVGARPWTSKEGFILVQFYTRETLRSQPR